MINNQQMLANPDDQFPPAQQPLPDDQQVLPQPPIPVPSQQPPEDTRMYDAQMAGNKQREYADLLRGFQQVLQGSASGSGFKADMSMPNQMEERAKIPEQQVKEQLAQEASVKRLKQAAEDHKAQMDEFQLKVAESKLNLADAQATADPNSAQSKLAQDRVIEKSKELGKPVNEDQVRGMSGKALFPLFPFLQQDTANVIKQQELDKEINSREKIAASAQENKKDIADMMNQNRMAAEKEKESQKNEKVVDDFEKRMKDDMDPNKARGGNLARNQAQVDQADRLKQLYTESNGDIRNLDSRQMEELAIGMNKMLSGSANSSVTQVAALVPKTIVGNASKLKEWLLNDPQGNNQVSFVQRMAETVDRERQVAQDQVKRAQIQRLSGYNKFKDLSPERYNSILMGYGIDPNEIDEKGQFKRSTSSAPKAGGSVRMQDPQGNIRLIPEDQVDAAKAAGGVLAQ